MARERCEATGKQRFTDRLSALWAQRNWATPMSAYECPDCKGWHLTSKHYQGVLVTNYAGGDPRLA